MKDLSVLDSPRLFIHIPKNGGMTLRRHKEIRRKIILTGAGNHISEDYTRSLLQAMTINGDHHGNEHARWRDVRQDLRDNYPAFAFVRNPWDRVASRYFFAKKVIEVEKNQPKSYADVSSFEAFLEERHKWGGKQYMWHRAVRGWYPAYDHVCDEKQKVRCQILNFHDMDRVLPIYFKLDHVPERRNVTMVNKGTYQDIYTPETIQIVADWYKKDINHWGFDFDTGPTRNYYEP